MPSCVKLSFSSPLVKLSQPYVIFFSPNLLKKFFRGIKDGAVELYHNNSKKFETTSTGATVTGELKTTTLEIGGTDVTATATELNHVDGVTSAIQTQLDAKQATITGGATTIDTEDLTASRALVSSG